MLNCTGNSPLDYSKLKNVLTDVVKFFLDSENLKNITVNVNTTRHDYDVYRALLLEVSEKFINGSIEAVMSKNFSDWITTLKLNPVTLTIDYDGLFDALRNLSISNSSYWKELIDYYIDHDYNITGKIYGQTHESYNKRKRFSFVGYLEQALLAVAHQVMHLIKELLHDILEPLFKKAISIILSLSAEIVKLIIDVLKLLWQGIRDSVTDNPELVQQFVDFMKWLFGIIYRVIEYLLLHLVEMNETLKVLELVVVFVVSVYYLKGYVISAFIVVATGYFIGIERTIEHTIVVILIFIISFNRYLLLLT